MAIVIRRRSLVRYAGAGIALLTLRWLFFSSTHEDSRTIHEIQEQSVLDYVQIGGSALDVQRHRFLQARMGRDERPDILDTYIHNGLEDYWDRFQKPYIQSPDTALQDSQSVLTSIDQLLALNGWVAALCSTLARPFGQNKESDAYDALIQANHMYYIGIVVHSADHFLVDQLAVIVQLAKTLGNQNIFVSMLDYHSSDSTETLIDLTEAVMILLGVPYRIRRVPSMTSNPSQAYYPAEEAYMRNMALEPLKELYVKRKIKFHRVIWLKGFTCPNDILENIKVSIVNDAAMVCGMDWSEYNGFYIFSDRWRTRDIRGDQFRQAKSSSKPDAGPPRDPQGAERYARHLPFQVFCCESGTHVVDPSQSYYNDIMYRYGTDYYNATLDTAGTGMPEREAGAPCLDSAQAWFCRDLWVHKAAIGVERARELEEKTTKRAWRPVRRAEPELEVQVGDREEPARGAPGAEDEDADVGADYDAMNGEEQPPALPETASEPGYVPNSAYTPARILVNPRCVTTYAGVSHTQLARDLFGSDLETEGDSGKGRAKHTLDTWQPAPESFVCQEQASSGGRKAVKTQRRLEFSVSEELHSLGISA